MISLWVATSYLLKHAKNNYYSLITALPATFMSAVSLTYILMAKEGFSLPASVSYVAGALFAGLLFCLYIYFEIRNTKSKGEQ